MTMIRRTMTRMVTAAAAVLLVAAQAAPARAESILNFGFNNSGSVTATGNASTGITTIDTTANNESATITLLNGATVNITGAQVTLTATSVYDTTTVTGSVIQEEFNGSFSITWGSSQQYYLDGTFNGLTFGFKGGSVATLASSDPPSTVTFTSNAIGGLALPRGANFEFTNVNPLLKTVGTGTNTTIGSFTASGTGSFSASPEPSSMALAGLGALGLVGYGLRRKGRTA
jgi:hypothetical protein